MRTQGPGGRGREVVWGAGGPKETSDPCVLVPVAVITRLAGLTPEFSLWPWGHSVQPWGWLNRQVVTC